jgi:TldD protein
MTLEILNNIDALGKDFTLADPGFCGKGQLVPVGDGGPHVRIKEAIVG